MFCPTCGGSNPDGSRFCNQCGATLLAPGGAVSTAQGSGVTRAPTAQGTGDRIELPMVGPSKRTLVAMLLGVGLGCLGLGALAAWKTLGQNSAQPPVTPVGLFGEPSSVTSAEPTADAGPTEAPGPHDSPSRPTRAARPTATTPAHARPTTVASNERPTPATPTTPTGNTQTGNPEPGETPTPTGSAATPTPPTTPTGTAASPTTPTTPTGADPTPTSPTTPSAPLPAEPGGVRERVPGTPAGSGFRLGDETDATGHMDPAAFRFVYDHYRSQIASCYSNATRNDTPVSGVIVMRVRIGEDGHVRNTRIISDSARTPALTRCVQTSVQSWRYPRPEGGEVEVDYPMRFGSSR